MTSDSLLRLDQQICFPLYAASRLVTQAYEPHLKPLGLTYPQYLVLLVLWEEAPLSVKQLGERLLLDSGTLTPLLKRMEAKGWVVRERSREDARVVNLALTPQGRALKKKAAAVPQALACQLGLPPQELRRLRTRLQQLLRTLNAVTSPGAVP